MPGMKDFLLVGVLAGFIFCTAPVQAAIKVHCSGEGSLVYLIGGGHAFTTCRIKGSEYLKTKG